MIPQKSQSVEAANRLMARIEDGTLIRNAWTIVDKDGRETVCLLAAMYAPVGEAQNAAVCPAEITPAWLAHLTPWIDDSGSVDEWPKQVRRFAACVLEWYLLDEQDWERCHQLVRAACVREAMRHTTAGGVLAICEDIASTLESGKWPDTEQKMRAAGAAGVARAAAEAAWAAGARVAEEAALWAARAARAVARAVAVDTKVAEAAADRMIHAILTILESAIAAKTIATNAMNTKTTPKLTDPEGPTSDVKFCKNCKHYASITSCRAPDAEKSMVTGESTKTCYELRNGACGREAKWFVARDQPNYVMIPWDGSPSKEHSWFSF